MESTADEMVYCATCGSEVGSDVGICPSCGATQNESPVQQPRQQEAVDRQEPANPTGRYVAAAVGALVSFFVGWFPFIGPIVPGIVAGYLRGSNTKESALTGTLANVIASIPIVGLLVVFFGLGAIGMATEGNGDAGLGFGVLLLLSLVSFVYYYGFGALGGVIGAGITDRGEPE